MFDLKQYFWSCFNFHLDLFIFDPYKNYLIYSLYRLIITFLLLTFSCMFWLVRVSVWSDINKIRPPFYKKDHCGSIDQKLELKMISEDHMHSFFSLDAVVVIGGDYIRNCKSNYHTITTSSVTLLRTIRCDIFIAKIVCWY
jgi:hypothetical protein